MAQGDAELVRRFLEGRDEGAFRALVERHAGPVLRTAHRVTGDLATAEDAAQETFLAVMRGLRRFEPRRSFRAWILGIAVKCATKLSRDRFRRRRREEERSMTAAPQPPTPPEEAHRREMQILLAAALEELPAPRRVALHLHYREGLSHAEVAAALGISTGTAKSRIARGLEELRERLGSACAPVLLPSFLARLPGPSPTRALLEACAAKSLATGPAVALPLAKKIVAAALLAGAGTVAAVGFLGGGGPAPRGKAPAAVAEELPSAGSPSAPPGGLADPGTAGDEKRGERDATTTETRPADAPRPPGGEAEASSPAGGAGAGEPGKVWRPEDLPGGTQVVRGVEGAPLGAQQGREPGGMRPSVRGWTKFAPPPRHRGDATLAGSVVDAAGAPVEGAEVYRMPLDVDRSKSTVVSFEFLAKIATTRADGTFEAEAQEHGTFHLVANYARLLNRPLGLETRDAVVVQVAEKGAAEGIALRVPFEVGELVPLRGVVTDEEGRAVEGAQVYVDYQEFRTDADGKFDAGRVSAGTRAVLVRRTGYSPLEGTVEAVRGRENVAHLVLALKEKGGLRLAGLVLDERGVPVPDATLYLNAPGETVRSVRTGESGRYAFEQLPERLAQGATLNVAAKGYFPKYVKDVPLPADPLEIRLDRAVRLVVKVVSGATGEPLQQIRGEARRETAVDGQTQFRMFRSWSVYEEDGTLDDLDVPVGRLQLELEAPGHAVTTLDLEIAPDEERREIEARLPAASGGER